MKDTILIAGENRELADRLASELEGENIGTRRVPSDQALLQAVEESIPHAVVLALPLGLSGAEASVASLRADFESLPIIAVYPQSVEADARILSRCGVNEILPEECDAEHLRRVVGFHMDRSRLARRVDALECELRSERGTDSLVGRSRSFCASVEHLRRAAQNDVCVLLRGEEGSGTRTLARALHDASTRADGPFVEIDCEALGEDWFGRELLGYEQGAFAGATEARSGCFERAEGGVLFLWHVHRLHPETQVRLLRVLEQRSVQRIGSGTSRPVDVRVVAETDQNLQGMVERGEFRQDLYYRLAVFSVEIPPLREREGDLALLASFFLDRYAQQHGSPAKRLTRDALAALESHDWPLNLRELASVMERAVLNCPTEQLRANCLPEGWREADMVEGRRRGPIDLTPGTGILPFEEYERRILAHALDVTGWNVKEAATRLRIGRATLYRKIDRYSLRNAQVKRNVAG